MSKLILHVGMPKTGSSYLQGILNKNKSLLEETSSIRILNGIDPHVIACHLINDSQLLNRSDIRNLNCKYTDSIRNQLISYSKKTATVIMSSEYFVLCKKEDIESYFNNIFESIDIVIAVRRQDRLLASGFNQDVKALGRTSNLTWNSESSTHLDYWAYCEKWKNNVIKVIDYDHAKRKNNGLISAFCQAIEVDYKKIKDFMKSPDDNSSNLSLSHKEVIFKLAMNRYGITKDNKILEEFGNSINDKSTFKLPIAYERVIASYYKKSNQLLLEKYLPNSVDSELNFNDLSEKVSNNSFSWNPLNGFEEILEFMLSRMNIE